jgi:hypothetical protein
VDGAGTWRHAEGRITLEPFGRLAAADRRSLEGEAEGFEAPRLTGTARDGAGRRRG